MFGECPFKPLRRNGEKTQSHNKKSSLQCISLKTITASVQHTQQGCGWTTGFCCISLWSVDSRAEAQIFNSCVYVHKLYIRKHIPLLSLAESFSRVWAPNLTALGGKSQSAEKLHFTASLTSQDNPDSLERISLNLTYLNPRCHDVRWK